MLRSGAALCFCGLLLLACLIGGRLAVPPGGFGDLDPDGRWVSIAWALAAGLPYLAGVALVRSRKLPTWSLAAALAVALAARLVLLTAPPVNTTDLYRYVWDGRVQAAGINPYLYLPTDPALASLRDPGTGPEAIYPNINRADRAPTIYPPAAQMLFRLLAAVAPSIWGVKAAMLLLELAAGASAWGLLRAARLPSAFILVWAWNPLIIREFAGAGHIDAAALAASGLAMLLAVSRQSAAAGVALGLAILCKLLPAAYAPAIWRPRTWRAPAAALVTVLAFYACYASAGWRVLGFLPGYAQEERLTTGGGFLWLRLLALVTPLPDWAGPAYIGAALLLLAALALALLRRDGPPSAERVARDSLLLSFALFLALTPHYPWYLAMIVLPATVVPRWGALWPSLAGPILYWQDVNPIPLWSAIVYVPALVWFLFELRVTAGGGTTAGVKHAPKTGKGAEYV